MFLAPFGWLYGKITDLRNLLYEKGFFRTSALGAPAVSVGNITAGGTGKTPFVVLIARLLAAEGEKVCVLTRGYGRDNPRARVLVADGQKILADEKRAGDEPLEIAVRLGGGAVIVADADRRAAAQWAREKFGVTAFVLDDAFQHRRARRDLDIVLIDATDPFGNGRLLPAGRLREPLPNLKRADLIVITRANLLPPEEIAELKSRISRFNPLCPVFVAENRIAGLVALEEFAAGRSTRFESTDFPLFVENQATLPHAPIPHPASHIAHSKSVLAFCGLGNPDNFFAQLESEDFRLTATRPFPDHHRYAREDVAAIEEAARAAGAEALLTTGKDAVKLTPADFSLPCFVVESEIVLENEKKLREILRTVFNSKSAIPNPYSQIS